MNVMRIAVNHHLEGRHFVESPMLHFTRLKLVPELVAELHGDKALGEAMPDLEEWLMWRFPAVPLPESTAVNQVELKDNLEALQSSDGWLCSKLTNCTRQGAEQAECKGLRWADATRYTTLPRCLRFESN